MKIFITVFLKIYSRQLILILIAINLILLLILATDMHIAWLNRQMELIDAPR